MKEFIATTFFSLILINGLKSQIYAFDQSYILSSQTGACIIDQPQNSIDSDLENYTLYQMNTLNSGEMIKQTLYFDHQMPEGSAVHIIVEAPQQVQLTPQLINSLTISSEANSLFNNDLLNASALVITAIDQGTKYRIVLSPAKKFDAITLTLNSGIADALSSIRVYGAYVYPNLPPTTNLMEFEGKPNLDNIILNWKIGYEINFINYTVERSEDGIFFEPIGVVLSNGYSSIPSDYQFTDNNPNNGFNYYRIFVTDVDGEKQYFSSIAVKFEKENPLSVFPNPSYDNQITVFTGENEAQLLILDASGTTIYQSEISGKLNLSPTDLALTTGYYTVIAITNDDIYTQKLIIR